MNLLSLSSKSDQTARLSIAWREANWSRLYCPKCKGLLAREEVRGHDIDLDPEYFPPSRKRSSANYGPMIVVWVSSMQVLRRDVVEVLQLPPELFHMGSVSIGGVLCESYVTVVADPKVRIRIHPNVWISEGSCPICGRSGGVYDGNAGFWAAAEDIGDKPIVADEDGHGPYIIETLLSSFSESVRNELRVKAIPLK